MSHRKHVHAPEPTLADSPPGAPPAPDASTLTDWLASATIWTEQFLDKGHPIPAGVGEVALRREVTLERALLMKTKQAHRDEVIAEALKPYLYRSGEYEVLSAESAVAAFHNALNTLAASQPKPQTKEN